MSQIKVEVPPNPKAADRIRVCLLYRKNNIQTVAGSPKCMERFAKELSAFMVNYASSEGDVIIVGPSDIEEAIINTIRRSTKGGNSNRTLMTLTRDDRWVVTITPIFPVGAITC